MTVSFDQFKELDLRVAKVLEASRVEGSEKLLKLSIDIGDEKRQLIAGVGKVYEPESLIGKEIVVVVNLEPKTMMGFESRGMLLAAHDENGNPVLLMPEKETPPGSKIT